MPTPSLCYLRDIQTLFETGTASNLSDRQLLERFVGKRDGSDETAFEVLVLRHGPMVLRVCYNVLQDPTDAQDAFQATFLVLVRRCRSIRRLESVGSWLYGVAYRVASRARLDAARRRAAERRRGLRVVAASDPADGGEAEHAEFGPVIQEEVRRLPEKYRAVVVLCYWQGLNQEQAAARLGCPLGTVRSRLARARKLLHRRLTRRGLAPIAGIVTVTFDRASTSAEVLRLQPIPLHLVQSTIRAACHVAARQATTPVASAVVASLVQRVHWSMTMIKINSLVSGLVLVGLIGYGAAFAALQHKRARAVQPPVLNSTGQPAAVDQGLEERPKNSDQPPPANGSPQRSGEAKLYSNVPSTVIAMRPNGSTVKKGEVVCELDSAALRDQLTNQNITVESARANFENAKLTREIAEITVVEYEEGLYKMRLQEIAGDIKIAEAELALAEDDLKVMKDKVSRGLLNRLETKRAELPVLRAGIGLEKAQNRHKILRDFTGPKRIRNLKSNVETTRSNELAKKAIWDLETEKEKKLERQIAACVIKAPRDGRLGYVSEGLVEGSAVRERQLLFSIVPPPSQIRRQNETP